MSNLLNMSPRPGVFYITYCWYRHSKHFAYFFKSNFRIKHFSDYRNIFFCKDRLPMSAFFSHIFHILFMGSSEKMERINTTGVVTFMKDSKAFRYGSISKLICESVRSIHFFVPPKFTIPKSMFRTCPFPTSCFSVMVRVIMESTRNAAKILPTKGCFKFVATELANPVYFWFRHAFKIHKNHCDVKGEL
jgi:hypothetical protein